MDRASRRQAPDYAQIEQLESWADAYDAELFRSGDRALAVLYADQMQSVAQAQSGSESLEADSCAGGEAAVLAERWVLTYADIVTLLLAMFVVLFAVSQIHL